MTTDIGGATLHKTVRDVLSEYPVTVGFLFGSRGRDEAHAESDVDVAVAFDGLEPGSREYNNVLFGLSADLAAALGTDDIDVVDLRRAPPELARAVFDDGTLLVGTDRDVERLRDQLRDVEETQSPAERFDAVLAAIDDHLA